MGPLPEVGSPLLARAFPAGALGSPAEPSQLRELGKYKGERGRGGGGRPGPPDASSPPPLPPWPGCGRNKRPLDPCLLPRNRGRPAIEPPHPPTGCVCEGGNNVTWSPGVQRSCQPQVHGLSPPPGSLRVDHHTPPGESNQNPRQRKRPTPDGPARSTSLCVLLIPLQSLKAEAREPNPNRSRNGSRASSSRSTRLLHGSRESEPRAHIQRSQVRGGWRGDGEGARPARSPGCSCGARGEPAGLNQGLNLVRPGDLAGLKSSGPGAAAAARGAKNEAAAAATGQRRPCAEGGRREREEEEEGVRRQRRKQLPGGRLGLPNSGRRLNGTAAG